MTPIKVNHVFATKCISHNIPNLINQLPNEIRDRFHTHSFSGFVLYTRKYLIKCTSPNVSLKIVIYAVDDILK